MISKPRLSNVWSSSRPPRALAVIRPLLSMRAEAAVIGAIAKDFTKISIPEIENRLRALNV